MNHPWQQPIRPLEVHPNNNQTGVWYPVLFIRPRNNMGGWDVMSTGGYVYGEKDALIRFAD